MGIIENLKNLGKAITFPGYSVEQIEEMYPDLKGWFPEHFYGVVYEGKRLPTGKEKAEMLGGVELLKGNLKNAYLEEIILRACRTVPMY